MNRHLVAAALLALTTLPAGAVGLTVLADRGGEPVGPLLMAIAGNGEAEYAAATARERDALARGDYRLDVALGALRPAYPLKAPIAAGSFDPRDFAEPRSEITQPIALVGTDPLSQQWLAQHAARLKELGAWVVVVDAPTEAFALQTLALYSGATVALDLSAFIEAYQVPALPALVTTDGVYQ